jgi:hypothetical protein
MPNETDYALEQAQVEALAALLGLDIAPSRSPYGLERQQRDLLMLLAQKGLGQTIDTTPPPEEEVALPPVGESDPEPAVVEPVVLVTDTYVPDLNSYSPYNKPRLSPAGSPDYFPAAITGTPGTQRFFGISFNNVPETLAFRRLEVPFRRKNVEGGEKFGLLVLKKTGNEWVTVATRFATLVSQQARMVWAKTLVFPKGESWAIIFGFNGDNPPTNIFYGSAASYPAPYANSGVAIDQGMSSTPGLLYSLTAVPGSHRMIRLYGVNLPKDVIGPLALEDLPAGTSSFDVPFSFNADASGYYIAKRAVTLGAPQVGGSGTVAYALSTTGTFNAATFPLTMAAGNILRVTVTGLTSGQYAAVNTVATVL